MLYSMNRRTRTWTEVRDIWKDGRYQNNTYVYTATKTPWVAHTKTEKESTARHDFNFGRLRFGDVRGRGVGPIRRSREAVSRESNGGREVIAASQTAP